MKGACSSVDRSRALRWTRSPSPPTHRPGPHTRCVIALGRGRPTGTAELHERTSDARARRPAAARLRPPAGGFADLPDPHPGLRRPEDPADVRAVARQPDPG